MTPGIPHELLEQASEWQELHRWERSQLGKALRSLGLTFTEIQQVIPVPKSTLSNWCREVSLTANQIDMIKHRTGPHVYAGIPRDTQWKRRLEIERIRTEAREFGESHLTDSAFVGGVVLYWGEGAKTRNCLDLVNSDPAALRSFIRWVRRYLDAEPQFVLSMHLHQGNDEAEAKEYWARTVGLHGARFTKTFIKPAGTGHRKNHLKHGVCRVRTQRAGDHWQRVMVWIDVIAADLGPIDDSVC